MVFAPLVGLAYPGEARSLATGTSFILACDLPIPARPAPHRITILGTMYWPPNVEGVLWFAQQVFPRVLREAPGAVLTIIGKNPPPALQDLARRAPGSLEVTGYVADPRAYLAETAAFAVPLLSGGGMRVKILDAWAWGLPVVSTALGAEGIEVRPGEDALIADTPGGFAESCMLLLTRPALRQRIGAAGRTAVRERYDAGRVYDALEGVYARCLGGR